MIRLNMRFRYTKQKSGSTNGWPFQMPLRDWNMMMIGRCCKKWSKRDLVENYNQYIIITMGRSWNIERHRYMDLLLESCIYCIWEWSIFVRLALFLLNRSESHFLLDLVSSIANWEPLFSALLLLDLPSLSLTASENNFSFLEYQIIKHNHQWAS